MELIIFFSYYFWLFFCCWGGPPEGITLFKEFKNRLIKFLFQKIFIYFNYGAGRISFFELKLLGVKFL